MSQKLVIEWDRNKVTAPPFTESFFCKTQESAEEIIDSKGRDKIAFAAWHVSRGFPQRSPVVLVERKNSPDLEDWAVQVKVTLWDRIKYFFTTFFS